MKAMKRTLLVGASMFAFVSGVSAQVGTQDLESYQDNWKKSHNVVEMSPAQYEQMKNDWIQQTAQEERANATQTDLEKRASEAAAKAQLRGLPADFPYKKNTGNAEADEDAYQLEKALWIENNREAYDAMTTKPTPPTKEQLEERRQVLNNQIK